MTFPNYIIIAYKPDFRKSATENDALLLFWVSETSTVKHC